MSTTPTSFKEEPVQLIGTENNQLSVNPVALEILNQISKPLVIVGVAGMYRTGKSYLLNKMILNRKGGFETKGTVNSCTKGIWMWGKPLKYERTNGEIVSLVVLDSEGLAAVDQDKEHDSRVFSLVLLLSSVFIYNGVGTIDEESLGGLSLIVNLSNIIRVKEDNEEATEEDYAEFMPDFVWVLRDFALNLVDTEGNEITPNEYLENALEEREGDDEVLMEKNRIRQVIRGCFQQRDCYPLVRPVIDEAQLQNLESLEDYDLRQDFLRDLTNLRGKLFADASTKKLNGNELDGRMMAQLIEQYVTRLNGDDVPVVQNIWDYICEENCNKVYEEVFLEYEKMMAEIRGVMTPEEINFSHQNSLKTVLEDQFDAECQGSKKEEYRLLLVNRTLEYKKEIVSQNLVNFQREITDLMEEEFQILEKQVMLSDEENFDTVVTKLGQLEVNVMNEVINGPQRKEIINEKMLDFVKSLGYKIFEKQERKWKRVVEVSEKQKQNEKASNERIIGELSGEIQGLKGRKRELEGALLETKRSVGKGEEKIKKLQMKLEKQEQQWQSKMNEKLGAKEESEFQLKEEMKLVKSKLKSFLENKMKEKGQVESSMKMKEQNMKEMKMTVERLRKEMETDALAKNTEIQRKENELMDMVLRHQKEINQKEGLIRRFQDEMEDAEETREALEKQVETLRAKMEKTRAEMQELMVEKEELQSQVDRESSKVGQKEFMEGKEVLKGQIQKLGDKVKQLEEENEELQHQKESELKKMQMEGELLQQQIMQLKNRVSILEREREEAMQNYLNLLNAKNSMKKKEGEGESSETQRLQEIENELERLRTEKQFEAEESQNKIEELKEEVAVFEAELTQKTKEIGEDKKEMEEKLETEREEKETLRKKLNEKIWELESSIENLGSEARSQIRDAEELVQKKLNKKETDFIKKTEELDKVLREQGEIHEKEVTYYRSQMEDMKNQYELSRKKLAEKYDAQILEQITSQEQENRENFERIEALQNMNQQLDASIMNSGNQISALEAEVKEMTERAAKLVEEKGRVARGVDQLKGEFEKEREEWEKREEMSRIQRESELEKMQTQMEDKIEEIGELTSLIRGLKQESLQDRKGVEEELVQAVKENERLSQMFTLEKMRIENSVQLKEQDIMHLKDQLTEKRDQMDKLKMEMEAKIKSLEGSKGMLISTLRKDFDEERQRMKSDFELKKRTLKEKVLNMSSIISHKDQEIDSHMSTLKISHKELIKEKEKHELEKKHLEKQVSSYEDMKMELRSKTKMVEESRKKLKKKDHVILITEQGCQSLKQMHEKDKIFWDDQLKEQRKKNEKLTMELANIFQNSIQNKNSEEDLRMRFENKYKQLTNEMNLKEESYKNKFSKSVVALEKNRKSLNSAKQQIEIEKRNLKEKRKNLEKLTNQFYELKGKESRLQERLEQLDKKHTKEQEQTKERFLSEKNHLETKLASMESKIDKLENDNKRKQNQLFAAFNQNNSTKRQLEKELQEKTDRLDMILKKNELLEKKITTLQTRLQNRNSIVYGNSGLPTISHLIKGPNIRNDRSGLFSDNISESYTNNRFGQGINMSRIGSTPMKVKKSNNSSTLENMNSSSNNILDNED